VKRLHSLLPRTVTAGIAVLMVLALQAQPARWSGQSNPSASARTPAPEPPRGFVETTFPVLGGRTLRVPRGGDLQAALDTAEPGDLITLEPRATYHGPFSLPKKDRAGWIVISAAPSRPGLPVQGRRVGPSDAAAMPKLVASSGSVIVAQRGAHHYRFVGLEIAPANGTFLNALVQLGKDDTELDALPAYIVFDRCFLHGDAKRGTRRGIAMNSRHTAVIDSYLSDFKEVGADSQAIASWNGAGPFRIANSYLEAAGENVMFGGADPTIRDLVPADIEIQRNHFAKPLRWKIGHETFEGVEWAVKNLFELKNARRVRIDGNLFEYNWPHGQNGFAILFTVRNQDGGAPWSIVEDVGFVNNVVRHVGSGINVLGRDDNHPSQRVRRLEIDNNLFLDVGGSWGKGRLFQLLEGTSDVFIHHNTSLQTGGLLFGGDGAAHTGFVFENNIALNHPTGISGSGTGAGIPALNRYFPASVVRRNVIVGGNASDYPPDNFFPATLDDVGFTAPGRGSFRLTGRSRYAHAGTDGRGPGADIDVPGTGIGLERLSSRGDDGTTIKAAAIASPATDGVPPARAHMFWLSLALLAYVYFGYPLVAALRATLQPKPRRQAPIQPQVSIILSAHDEGARIAARIDNLLALDYPRDRLQIVVGSDGSSDDTVERAREYVKQGVKVRPFPQRRGKPALINALVPLIGGEIVVFADARQRFDRAALRVLVANFADPAVGAVSGELILTADPDVAAAGEGTAFYWRYEKFLRSSESRVDSTVGATGAIYAIRRELFEPIPEDTILDDVLIPLRIVRRGYRVIFEPEARAYDQVSATAREEFARKARTIAGTFQLLARERWLFNPLRNRLWFETLSHKALRLAIPALQVVLFGANLALAHVWPYSWFLAAQVACYAAALLGCTRRQGRRSLMIVSIPHTICLLSWATLIGFTRMVTHSQAVTWERVSPVRVASARRSLGNQHWSPRAAALDHSRERGSWRWKLTRSTLSRS
jgi:cellulose synthase/poly-beta-1,6-N-acetylglucosamine synthase-like glycosyltransferase